MLFSANLGFLWTDRSLPEAIHAAKQAGFDAVECHWPYESDVNAVKKALIATGLPMVGLNTVRGDVKAGENGLSALPDRGDEAQAAIIQAVHYAAHIGCQNIHVMAGFSSGKAAENTFIQNLIFACDLAAKHNIGILIEPLNQYDAPDYFLNDIALARSIIEQVDRDNLKLMFDCYHIQILHGDITRQLENALDMIGHIQFASVPDRGAPDKGELNYQHIFATIKALGYQRPLGAEYKPAGGDTNASLGWLADAKLK